MSDESTTATATLREHVDLGRISLRHWLGLLALLVLAVAPMWANAVFPEGENLLFLRTLTGALFLGMFAMSWDVVSGYTGQISFGHSAFFAVGGYTSALLNLEWGVDPLAAVVAGTLLAAALGLLIGVPALRLEGPYLSLVTLVTPLIMLQVFIYRSDIFGGELGIPNPAPIATAESLGFIAADGFAGETFAFYYVGLMLFVGILVVLLAITRSDAGAVFTAIREDEEAVAASGLNPAKFKIFAFVLSAAVGGLAGAVYVHTIGKPSPSQLLVLAISIEVIIASVIGGIGTIVGAAAGGMFLYLFRDWLSGIEATVPVVGLELAKLDLVIFAVGTLVLLFVLPGGMLRWGIALGGKTRTRVTGGDVAVDGGQTPVQGILATYRDAIRRLRGGRDE